MSVININKMNNFNDIEEMYNNIKKLYMIKRGKDIKNINKLNKKARFINLCLVGIVLFSIGVTSIINMIIETTSTFHVSYTLVFIISSTICIFAKIYSRKMQLMRLRKIKCSKVKYMKKLCRDMVYNYSSTHKISDRYANILMKNSYNMLKCIESI